MRLERHSIFENCDLAETANFRLCPHFAVGDGEHFREEPSGQLVEPNWPAVPLTSRPHLHDAHAEPIRFWRVSQP